MPFDFNSQQKLSKLSSPLAGRIYGLPQSSTTRKGRLDLKLGNIDQNTDNRTHPFEINKLTNVYAGESELDGGTDT